MQSVFWSISKGLAVEKNRSANYEEYKSKFIACGYI